jgi:hypothetical protein
MASCVFGNDYIQAAEGCGPVSAKDLLTSSTLARTLEERPLKLLLWSQNEDHVACRRGSSCRPQRGGGPAAVPIAWYVAA